MRILRNFIIKENIKFSSILKYFTLTLLIWMCYLKSDKLIFCSHLKIEYNADRTLFASFNRLLAKHEIQEGLGSHRQSEFLSNNIMNKNMKNVLEYASNYEELNKRKKNDLDSYKKDYNRRYYKKIGLEKLDCYWEKKVFDKIEDIDKLVEKMQNDKKLLKKKLWYKFGIRFTLLSLIPVFGLIIPLVHNEYFAANFKCFSDCKDNRHYGSTSDVHNRMYPMAPIDRITWKTIYIANSVLFCVTAFIVLSILIYIFIKFIKYQRLKACRSKMSIKEYCKFCKSLFI